MSTYDCPGSNPANHDQLAMGCWSEHQDGSLIFVESTEGGRVVFSMFDLSKTPPIEYREAMAEASFKKTFSWKPNDPTKEKWLWHDKTPFDWDRVIKAGVSDGPRIPSREHLETAAERVAESLKLRGAAISRDMGHVTTQIHRRTHAIRDKLARAFQELLK